MSSPSAAPNERASGWLVALAVFMWCAMIATCVLFGMMGAAYYW
jgi:hypothetical protein